ncbi:hypothetical protein JNUCC42_21045 [Brevibacterium sp. JNUCC-42]|nr:hypothetical protein JNUCC42_21045 [Brevibacterium sp. JNUCC-42]
MAITFDLLEGLDISSEDLAIWAAVLTIISSLLAFLALLKEKHDKESKKC